MIRVGRFAGQYAKPRSADTETRDGVDAAELSRRPRQPRRSSPPPTRTPDPQLLLRGYERAGADAELHPRAGRRRLRRPAPSRVLGSRLRRALAARRRVPPHGRRIGDSLRFMETLVRQRRCTSSAASTSTPATRPAPALRAGADPPGAAPAGLVQPDARTSPGSGMRTAAARRRARRVLPRHRQSDRGQGRAVDDAGAVAASWSTCSIPTTSPAG